MNYKFIPIDNCEMCNSSKRYHKTLGRRLNKPQGYFPKNKIGITTSVVKCKKCGLIFSNPMPIPNNIQDHYGVFPEKYWEGDYFNSIDNYFQWQINKFKTLISYETDFKVLDIGSGIGKAILALERNNFKAYGVEPSRQFYEYSIQKMGLDRNKLNCEKIEDVEFDEGCFDFIILNAVLEHLYKPSVTIEKALKWLKKDGLLYIAVPSARWLTNKFINYYYKLIFSNYVGNLSPMSEPYHLYEFDLNSFYENSLINNYKIVSFDYHICNTFLPNSLDFIFKPLMKFTNTGMEISVWIKKK